MNALKSRLNMHFATCAAVAATAVVAAPQQAEAAIVYSGVLNLSVPGTTAGLYLNMVTGVTGTAPVAGYDTNPYNGGNNLYTAFTGAGVVSTATTANTAASNLLSSQLISAASIFTTGGGAVPMTNFTVGVAGIYGVKFNNELAGGAVRYGWVRIIKGATGTTAGTLVDYAWEDTGAGIIAGDTGVPAPGAIALLGVAGLVGGRRRRTA